MSHDAIATRSTILDQALSVATHPDAKIVAMGAEPVEQRSLFGRMNLKVKLIALAAVVAPALLILHGMAAGAAQPTAPSVHDIQAPTLAAALANTPVAAPVALAAPAAQPASVAPKAPDRLEAVLPNHGAGMSSFELARALVEVDLFASIATAVEDFKRKPYYDPGGLNVGMGYCVTKRLAEYGPERVKADLADAGFSADQVESLIKNKKAAVAKIVVEPINAVRLLESTRSDYRGLAEGAVGKELFDKMPAHRQAALTYLAYNTGDVGQFSQLVSALRKGNDSKAMMNLTVNWRDKAGDLHANHRQRSYLQAMFLGTAHFKHALDNPNAFESQIGSAEAETALADIAGAAQKPDGLRSKLLERRLKSNPWAFKALDEEIHKQGPILGKAL